MRSGRISAAKALVVATFLLGAFALLVYVSAIPPDLHLRGRRRLRANPPPQPAAAPTLCASQAFAQTELGGDVVRWGAGHTTRTPAQCCAACAASDGCNVWVHCSSASLCAELLGQCWLKRLDEPWADLPLLQGRAGRWTSGITQPMPPHAAHRAERGGRAAELALVTEGGDVRLRLFADAAPLAAAFVREVARVAPSCEGCRFYRAEPVPPGWGSAELPDSWDGGRWGPPYALLQGSFLPRSADQSLGPLPPKPPAEHGQRARPLIRRGMLAWAGGGGGADAFIALADHPEWGRSHTVWGEVLPEDMGVVDRLMERPLRTEDWGAIRASVFAEPLPFRLRALPLAAPSTPEVDR